MAIEKFYGYKKFGVLNEELNLWANDTDSIRIYLNNGGNDESIDMERSHVYNMYTALGRWLADKE